MNDGHESTRGGDLVDNKKIKRYTYRELEESESKKNNLVRPSAGQIIS